MAIDAEQEYPADLLRQAKAERAAGRLAEARACQVAAVARLRESGDPAALAHALRHLADMDHELQRFEAADSAYDEALSIYRAASDAPALDVANAVRAAAAHHEHLGRLGRAKELWAEAETRYAALDATFATLLGRPENPGVEEARRRLRGLEA